MRIRCEWARGDPLSIDYHDNEWGVPEHDDRKLFEFLILEGAQAGLSWLTILRKRQNYREAFDHFDARKIAEYDRRKLDELLSNKGIVRNRLKLEAAIQNAKAFLAVHPSRTGESDAMSRDLAERGFKFVGSIVSYAFMQAIGMVNDHTVDCFRYDEV